MSGIINKQKLVDAGRDADDLGLVVNGAEDLNGTGLVPTRFGGPIRTVRRVLAEIEADPPEGWVERLKGDKGDPAPLPDTIEYIAEAGQTVFEVPFDFPLSNNLLTVFVGGLKIPQSDYEVSLPDGPITFDVGRDLGEEVFISAYPPGGYGGSSGGSGIYRTIYARDRGDNTPIGTDEFELAYAFSKNLRVYAPEGLGSGPNGEYYCSSASQNTPGFENWVGNVPPGCELFGDGMDRTVFIQRNQTPYGFYYNPPGNNRVEYVDSAPGPYFHDFTIITNPIPGFEEHSHQICLNGMRGIRILRVKGIGAKGDMVHIGQGDVPADELGVPRQIRFNGEIEVDIWGEGYPVPGKRGANNRNVLSILSGLGVTGIVRGKNFSRPGGGGAYDETNIETGVPMPGIVDLEPNFAGNTNLLDDIDLTVIGENIGGFGASLFMPSGTGNPNPTLNITMRVYVRNARARISLYGDAANPIPHNLQLDGEDRDCERPFEMIRCRGVTLRGHSRGFKYPALAGYVTGAGDVINDFECHNHFHGGAELGGGAIWIRGGSNWHLGGSVIGGDVGFTFLSTNLFEKATITADIRGQSAYAFNVVNYGEGEPNLDWSTIDATGCNVHGQVSSAFAGLPFAPRDWAANGALVRSFPRIGSFTFGHRLFVKPFALGDATEAAAVASNVYPAAKPAWAVQKRLEPAPMPRGAFYDTAAMALGGGMIKRGTGKLIALADGYAFDPAAITITAGTPSRLEVAAPDTATTGTYYWYKDDNSPNYGEIGKFGIFFGGGQALATWDGNGPSNLNYANLGGADKGREFAIQVDLVDANVSRVRWFRKSNGNAFLQVAELITPNNGPSTLGPLYRYLAAESGEENDIIRWGAPA